MKSSARVYTPNFVTFDVEEWFMGNYPGLDWTPYIGSPSRIDYQVEQLILLCAERKIRATCFVVGSLAREKPHLVRALSDAGHEIASHSYAHQLVYGMTPEQFREDLRRSIDVLQNIVGRPVQGFRAPSWSVKKDMLHWYYATLEEAGLRYSSSVFPGHTYLYGIDGFPQHIHRPTVGGRTTSIVEIPQRLIRVFGRNLGFAGGFYLRFFPSWFILHHIKRFNRKQIPLFLYLHPREIDPHTPKLPLEGIDRIIHNWGVSSCKRKFLRVLDGIEQPFETLADYTTRLSGS
jgi:polysaccharide deacetylase family protein (PEP-CTERM system associated)